MRTTLTDAAIQRIKAPATGYVEVWDRRIGGFGVRVRPSGRKSFVYLTRINGRPKRFTLGTYPDLSLAKARKKASEIAEARAEGKISTVETDEITFGDVAREYVRRELKAKGPDGAPRLARGWEIERIIERELLPAWSDRPWSGLRKRDAFDLFDALLDDGKPAASNKLHEIVRRIGRWAARRDMIDGNPFADMDPPASRIERDRVLSPDEIRAVWKACDVLGQKRKSGHKRGRPVYPGYPAGPCVKLLFLTGARLSEAAQAQWGEFDLEARIWTVPGSRTKNNAPHTIHLSDMALSVVKSLPRFQGGDHVFSTRAGKVPISGFSKIKASLDDESGVTGWRLHDIRRSARTLLAECGVPERIAERCLNHVARNRLVLTYDRHTYANEMKDAFDRLGARIRDIVTPPPDKIVKLRQRSA